MDGLPRLNALSPSCPACVRVYRRVARAADRRARWCLTLELDYHILCRPFSTAQDVVVIVALASGYPGVLARVVTRDSYKSDTKPKQTRRQRAARAKILEGLTSGALANRYAMTVVANDPGLVDDPTGDSLGALLGAVQAAWAWRNRGRLFGGPRAGIDPREGWNAEVSGSAWWRRTRALGDHLSERDV